jgi:HAD superfamily hydrolase (TIGR01509 family)
MATAMMSATKTLAAILFDFDGVIVDSEALHHRAYEIALAPFGVTGIPKDVYADRFSNRGVGMEYCAQIVPGIDLAALKERKEAAFRELLENDARVLPGAVETVRALASSGTLALATGSRRAAVAGVLKRFRFDRSFSAVVTREDYDREKPAPDAFLRACRALGVEPAVCLVVEDSYKGLRASLAAGIPCVVVPNDYTRKADFTGAVAVLSTLAELDRERADALFQAARGARPGVP